MQNKSLEKLSPQKHLEKYTKLYPGVFETIDDLRLNRKKLGNWPDWCFCPIAGTHAAITKFLEEIKEIQMLKQMAIDFGNIAAIAGWRKTKGIYVFDEALLNELSKTELTGDIPSEVLKFLPEWVTYVQLPKGVFDDIIGFFTYLEYDVNTKHEELRIILDIEGAIRGIENGLACVTIHLGGSLKEGLEKTIRTGLEIAKKEIGLSSDMPDENYQAAVPKHLPALLNLILYLCSQNSEIRDTNNKPTLPKNPKPQKGGKVFNASEVKRWEVGYRLGNALRIARNESKEETTNSSHSSPKPHIRRAHWHTYWLGSKPDQKAILKWLPPIPVNITENNDNITTIRKVN